MQPAESSSATSQLPEPSSATEQPPDASSVDNLSHLKWLPPQATHEASSEALSDTSKAKAKAGKEEEATEDSFPKLRVLIEFVPVRRVNVRTPRGIPDANSQITQAKRFERAWECTICLVQGRHAGNPVRGSGPWVTCGNGLCRANYGVNGTGPPWPGYESSQRVVTGLVVPTQKEWEQRREFGLRWVCTQCAGRREVKIDDQEEVEECYYLYVNDYESELCNGCLDRFFLSGLTTGKRDIENNAIWVV
jgi:hypothetical protein